ncbi:MAG: pentapeptide repeat-containing protein [Coriobacteriia bacterium]|nr:pentapeptide repeat-containing protein [Coriobacteriia bacterium]
MSLTFMPIRGDATDSGSEQPRLWDSGELELGADEPETPAGRVIENEMYADDTVDEPLAGLTFRLCAFRDVAFDNARDLRGCTFEKCVFIGCTFKSVTLTGCSFNVCVFKQADFFDALFKDCRMLGCEILGARCTAMTVRGGDWSYANLAGLKFAHQELRDVRLREVSLTNCTFRSCDLTGSDLTRATARGASFTDCDLRGARLDGIAVAEATWRGSKIDLAQCIAIAQEVTGATYEEPVG